MHRSTIDLWVGVFVTAGLIALVVIGATWAPLFWAALPLAIIAATLPFAQAVGSAYQATKGQAPRDRTHGWRHVALP